MSTKGQKPQTVIILDRNAVNQLLPVAGVWTVAEFTTKRLDRLNEYNNNAGAFFFQPNEAGQYGFIFQWDTIGALSNPTMCGAEVLDATTGLFKSNFSVSPYIAPASGAACNPMVVTIMDLTPNSQVYFRAYCTAITSLTGIVSRSYANIWRIK